MKKKIWKYPILPKDKFFISMPRGAEILSVQNQNGMAQMLVLVNPDYELERRYFEQYVTGQEIEYDMGIERKYICTFQLNDGELVFHLFERIN